MDDVLLDIDWRVFDEECKRIVKEVSDKFIDLGMDDHQSDYAAAELQAKQERFKREFSRQPFPFETIHQMPAPVKGSVEEILEEPQETAEQADNLGYHLQGIAEVISGNMKARIK